jgi:hypothetical protein
MSYFALLSAHDAADGQYAAEQVHINIWSLPGLLAHRPMIFDLGVQLVTESKVKAIEVAIPARVSATFDLSNLLVRGDIAALIFSRLLGDHDANKRRFQLQNLGWIQVAEVDDRSDDTKSVYRDDHLTAIRLQLAGPGLESSTRAYLRVRFAIDHAGSLWRWERVLGRRNGLLIDFRCPSSREESSRRERRPALHDRALPIGGLDVFVMLPASYQLRNATPPLQYTRTLEGSSWDGYLRRSAQGLVKREHLMVHHWHHDEEIRPETVFRGFLQFNREPAFRAVTDLLLGALVALTLAYALFRPLTLRSGVQGAADGIANAASYLSEHLVSGVVGAGALAVIGVVLRLIYRARKLPSLYIKAKRGFKKLEYKLHTIRADR